MKTIGSTLILTTLLASGCAPKKPARPQPPAGYVQNGFCIPEAIDKYGDPTIIRCKQNDGKVFVYKR